MTLFSKEMKTAFKISVLGLFTQVFGILLIFFELKVFKIQNDFPNWVVDAGTFLNAFLILFGSAIMCFGFFLWMLAPDPKKEDSE